MTLIGPIAPITPITPVPTPINTISPFTYRSARSYQESLNDLRKYINRYIVGYINTELQEMVDEVQALLTTQSGNVDDAIAALVTEVNAAIQTILDNAPEANDPIVSALIADTDSATRLALNAVLADYVAEDDLDAAMAAILGTPGSDSKTVLDNRLAGYLTRTELFNLPSSFGVVGPAVDSAPAINAAAADALANNKVLFIPAGAVYRVDAPVLIKCDVIATGARLNSTHEGVALTVGADVSGQVVSRKRMFLPHVYRTAANYTGTSMGIKLQNLNDCTVDVPFVQNFVTGLLVMGLGHGAAYNVIRMGSLWENKKNLILDADASGWVNQNTFMGGRLQQTTLFGLTNDDSTSVMIALGVTAGSMPNNNTFIGTSIEGDNSAYYRADIGGRYNQFVNCRWESMDSESRIRFRDNAIYNIIDGGYDTNKLVPEYVTGSTNNMIRASVPYHLSASKSAAQAIPNSAWTTLVGMAVDTSNGVNIADIANGLFTPRQGYWKITASVMFAANATGQRRVRLSASGAAFGKVGDVVPVAGGNAQCEATGIRYFSGVTAFAVQAWQTSGADLNTIADQGYTRITAEYMGA